MKTILRALIGPLTTTFLALTAIQANASTIAGYYKAEAGDRYDAKVFVKDLGESGVFGLIIREMPRATSESVLAGSLYRIEQLEGALYAWLPIHQAKEGFLAQTQNNDAAYTSTCDRSRKLECKEIHLIPTPYGRSHDYLEILGKRSDKYNWSALTQNEAETEKLKRLEPEAEISELFPGAISMRSRFYDATVEHALRMSREIQAIILPLEEHCLLTGRTLKYYALLLDPGKNETNAGVKKLKLSKHSAEVTQ
jgi:hypothetical protein